MSIMLPGTGSRVSLDDIEILYSTQYLNPSSDVSLVYTAPTRCILRVQVLSYIASGSTSYGFKLDVGTDLNATDRYNLCLETRYSSGTWRSGVGVVQTSGNYNGFKGFTLMSLDSSSLSAAADLLVEPNVSIYHKGYTGVTGATGAVFYTAYRY